MLTISIQNESNLPIACRKLLDHCAGKRVFAFYGTMGAGKTTFIKSICKELGVESTITSPTYSLVNEYITQKGESVYHFDYYRIKDIREAYDMGYETYIYSGNYCFIEWPEKIEQLLPTDCVRVKLEVNNNARVLTII